MSKIKLFLFTFFVAAGLIACGGDTSQNQSTDAPGQMETSTDHDGHDHDGHDHDGHDHDGHSHEATSGDGSLTGAAAAAAAHGEGKEYNSAYVCPMHCEGSGSTEAGKCPVCKMDYVALKDHLSDGHNHKE